MARWQTCNVLSLGSQKKQLWVFGATSEKFPLQKEETKLPAEAQRIRGCVHQHSR